MATYIQIGSTITVGAGGAAYMEFTSIPQTYTDLIVKLSGRSTRSLEYDSTTVQFNTTSSSNYAQKMIYGEGVSAASVSSATISWLYSCGDTSTSNSFGNSEMYIPNYTSSNYKPVTIDGASENNATLAILSLDMGLWSDTSAITSIRLSPGSGNFMQYSSASLYGIS